MIFLCSFSFICRPMSESMPRHSTRELHYPVRDFLSRFKSAKTQAAKSRRPAVDAADRSTTLAWGRLSGMLGRRGGYLMTVRPRFVPSLLLGLFLNLVPAVATAQLNAVFAKHLKPVSESGPTLVNPWGYLSVLCPNCHAMIHRQRSNTLSVGQLKAIINRASAKRDGP